MGRSPLPAAIGIVRSARPTRATHWLAARSRTAAVPMPCGLYAASPTGAAGVAEQERDLRAAVPCQRRDAAEIAADPEHLGAEIGFFSVLHTWGQNLLQNPHS